MIFNVAPDAIIIVNSVGEIVLANQKVKSTFGYEIDEVVGKTVELLIPKRFHTVHHNHRNDYINRPKIKEMGSGDLLGKKKDGTEIYVETTLSPFEVEGETMVAAIVRDVSNKIKLKNKLKETLSDLEWKNKELEKYAYIASHDLKQPLRNITSLVNLMELEYEQKLDNGAEEYLSMIKGASDRMQNLIDGLLEYSRIGQDIEFELINMNDLIAEVRQDLAEMIKENKATFLIEPLPSIKGHKTSIRQLFQNLIANAIKFQQPGACAEIKIRTKKSPTFTTFSVSDNGIGMDQASTKKIFDIFHRLHSLEEYEGTGIGLAHCKKIVATHKGELWVTSTLKKGSTFFFTFPNIS